MIFSSSRNLARQFCYPITISVLVKIIDLLIQTVLDTVIKKKSIFLSFVLSAVGMAASMHLFYLECISMETRSRKELKQNTEYGAEHVSCGTKIQR